MTRLAPFAAEWPAISALLDEALSLPASEHASWLAKLGVEHDVHREALRTLLAHRPKIETDDFLAELPSLQVDGIDAAGVATNGLVEGGLVGVYRLISEIGRGGMGTVWLAQRSDGTMKRRVALKLPLIVWGDTFSERLGREREILATLEHEHIARLYDAGVDAHGRPFLAMEYIEGEPIDTYCRAHTLPVRERMALLLQVAAAVSHAHARLVVHRDLKPGNILVSKDARVHLLDFGIAKLLEGDRTRQTSLTEFAGRALTLDYASPEQIRGEPLGTASDVYSMAVVAFEVLTGSRPYRLKRGSAAELEEAIATAQPPLASTLATDRRIARQLRGDVDSILNKALKKEPSDRYQTMEAFADELRRVLAGEPVAARPDGLRYRAAKFVQRHRLQVAAAAAIVVALITGTSLALWQAREARLSAEQARIEALRAQTEAATAKAVQGFIESVFKANSGNQADPVSARGTTARALLDRGAERIENELSSAPEAQLRLYDVLAEMYANMALFERSLALMRRNLALATRLHGKDSVVALETAVGVAQLLDNLGRSDEALATLLETDAVASTMRKVGPHTRMLIDNGLARLYFTRDLPKGVERARSAAAIARALGPSLEGISALHVAGEIARKSGHLREARQALVDAAAWIGQQPQGSAGELSSVLGALGALQNQLGQPELAEASFARAIAMAEKAGDQHSLHNIRGNWSRYQYDNGLLHEAVETAEPDYAWARALQHKQEFGALPGLLTLQYGRSLVAYGDAARGLTVLDEARGLLPAESSHRLGPFWAARAEALISMQRLAEGGADVERAMSMLTGADAAYTQMLYSIRRRYWVSAGKAEEALQDFSANPPQAGETATAYTALRRQAEEATLLLAAGHHTAARTTALGVLAAIDRLPERRFTRDAQAQMTAVLGQALLREDRVAESLPVLQSALTLHLAEYDPTHSPATAQVRLALAEARRRAAR